MENTRSQKRGEFGVKGLYRKRTKLGHRFVLCASNGAGKMQSVTLPDLDNLPDNERAAAIADARRRLAEKSASFDALIADYCASRKLAPSTQTTYGYALRGFGFDAAKNSAQIKRVVQKRTPTASEYVIRIRLFFDWLRQRGYDVRNPADGVRIENRSVPRSRIFTTEQLARLDAYSKRSEPAFRLFVLLLMHTGARLSTVASIRDSDLNGKMLCLYNYKRKKYYDYQIPIHCDEIVSLWPHIVETASNALRFSKRLNGWLYDNFGKDSRGQTLSTHSLRHHFASMAVQNGIPIELVAKLLDHQSIATTAKFYARFSESQICDAVQRTVASIPIT